MCNPSRTHAVTHDPGPLLGRLRRDVGKGAGHVVGHTVEPSLGTSPVGRESCLSRGVWAPFRFGVA